MATIDTTASVVHFFTTDNFGRDDYGYYDEDFAWTSRDTWYDEWNAADMQAWNDIETAHYDIYGYDDAGEKGLLDW